CYLCLLLHSLCSALSYSPRSHRDPHSFPTRRSSDLAAQLERLGRSCDPRIADGVMQVTSFDPDRLSDVDHVSEELEKLQGWLERSEEHTSELQSRENLVCRLLLEKKKTHNS